MRPFHAVVCALLTCAVAAPAAAQWQVEEMPERAQHAVVALQDGRLLALGGASSEGLQGTTLVYDGVWTEGPPLITARRGGAACVDGAGLVHFVGGYGDGSQRAEHEILDPVEMTWTSAAPLPAAGWELACATDPAGVVHVLGGESRLARHDIWDAEARAWVQGEPLPEGRLQHDAVFAPDGTLYIVGGGIREELRPDLLVWTEAEGWTRRAGPTVPVRQAAAAMLGDGALLVLGGSTAYNNNAPPFYDHVQLLDLQASIWRAGPPLPMASRELGIAVVGGRVHAVGGRAGESFVAHQISDLTPLVGAPTLEVEIPASVPEGSSLMLSALAGDPDGDRVQVTWELDGELSDGPFAVLRAPDGDAEIQVTVAATDALGGTTRIDRTVLVENLAPVFLKTPELTARPGFAYHFDARAMDPAGPADTVEVELVASPEDMEFVDQQLIWTPQAGVEAVQVTLIASDEDGAMTELSWTVSVGADGDRDGVLDSVDNCVEMENPAQLDADGDGMGDVCDPDDDNDGLVDEADNCPFFPGASSDLDGDGIGDICDPDDDNDGIDDPFDATPSGGLGQPVVQPSAQSADAACTIGRNRFTPWRFFLRR